MPCSRPTRAQGRHVWSVGMGMEWNGPLAARLVEFSSLSARLSMPLVGFPLTDQRLQEREAIRAGVAGCQ